MIIYIRKYGTMFLQVCKNWIHIKTELGGLGEDADTPQKK
jgi:hypothetical protein